MTTSSRHPAHPSGLLRALGISLGLILVLTAGVMPSATVGHSTAPARLDQFLWALAQQESGGSYTIRNRFSGAYGKYQIMPFNWPSWARRYIGSARARPTPRNQEIVARGKVIGLYRWLGSYERVAKWWLTGTTDPDRAHWSPMARRYVSNIMSLMRRAPGTQARPPAEAETPPPGSAGDGNVARTRWTTGWLNFRAGPGVSSPRIGPALRPGTRLAVLATERIETGRLWLRVRLPNQRVGWVSSFYTRD